MKIPLPEKYQVFIDSDDKTKIFDHDSKNYSKVMDPEYFNVAIVQSEPKGLKNAKNESC